MDLPLAVNRPFHVQGLACQLLRCASLADQHLLLITRSFEHQEQWLTPADFEALCVCMAEFEGLAMGIRHRQLPIHGVQFHPESIASEHGHALLKNFLKEMKVAA